MVRKLETQSSPVTYWNTNTVERLQRPDTVNGGHWIVYPDGSKFRTSTAYSVSRWYTENPSGQNVDHRFRNKFGVNRYQYLRMPQGGYEDELVLTPGLLNNSWPAIGGIGTMANSPYIPEKDRNQAVTTALNNIIEQSVNVGENLATLRQTISLVKSPLSALAGLLRSAYSNKSLRPYLNQSLADMRKNKDPFKSTARSYLAFVYGAQPLMQDIFTSMTLAKDLAAKPLLSKVTGKSRFDGDAPARSYNFISEDTTYWIERLNVSSVTRCTLWIRLKPDYAGTRALTALGLTNPALLAWELVPLSFVLDWVLPIGPTLSAMTAPGGYDFVDGSISTRATARGSYRGWKYSMGGPTSGGTRSYSTGDVGYEGYTREGIRSWPRPALYFDSDPFRGSRGLKALALSITGLRSLRT
jgi:hypothetical protein